MDEVNMAVFQGIRRTVDGKNEDTQLIKHKKVVPKSASQQILCILS